ncbi:hypothetical protein GCM10010990_07990 [Croceicoccus mobilis]|uniref:Uncharacterized protein n=1 Tax=Croceicoccus mobilis TaxID=1703339 RepID=A0A917DQE2_9SPHN|nr:hypothetical protein GCM10010990_07990 [Croceicoccus mobilis]
MLDLAGLRPCRVVSGGMRVNGAPCAGAACARASCAGSAIIVAAAMASAIILFIRDNPFRRKGYAWKATPASGPV